MRSRRLSPSVFPLLLVSLLLLALAGCHMNPTGLELGPGWQERSVAVWRNARPDMMALSPSGKWLYISCETNAGNAPSLVAINMRTGRQYYLISGLVRPDGLKFAPDDSLWIGEEFADGLIWRVSDADKLPTEQTVDRTSLTASYDAIEPFRAAGKFAHEGITFSRDKRFAYLADENKNGAIYRLDLSTRNLSVLDDDMHWRAIDDASDARAEARHLHALGFKRPEDMETMPDGSIVLAETGTGRILKLVDNGTKVSIKTLLHDARIAHPDNLAWDQKRHLLWITDDDKPSSLWAWDGKQAKRIASHKGAEITGVLPVGDDIYINLQGNQSGPDMTIRLFEKRPEPLNP